MNAIGIEDDGVRIPFEICNHPNRVFPFLDISLSVCMDCKIVRVKDGLEHFWIGRFQLVVSDVSTVCAYLVSDVVFLHH